MSKTEICVDCLEEFNDFEDDWNFCPCCGGELIDYDVYIRQQKANQRDDLKED